MVASSSRSTAGKAKAAGAGKGKAVPKAKSATTKKAAKPIVKARPAPKKPTPPPQKKPVSRAASPVVASSAREGGRQTAFIPLDMIRPDPNQPRRTFHPVDGIVSQEAMVELRDLADNIHAQKGLFHPITIRRADDDEGYIIVAGERRWRAYGLNRSLGRPNSDEIECFIREDISVAMRRLAQLAENLQREDLSDIDTAVYIKAIMDDFPELQQKNLAELLNKDPRWVSRILGLLDPRYADVVLSGHIVYASILEQFKALPEAARRSLHEKAKISGSKITSHQIRQEVAKTKGAAIPPVLPTVTGAEALQRFGLAGSVPGVDPALLDSVENALSSGRVPGEHYSPTGNNHNRQELRLRLSQALRLADVLENLDQNVSIVVDNEDLRHAIQKLGGKLPSDELGLVPMLTDLLTREVKGGPKPRKK